MINQDTVTYIASLSRLYVSAEEKVRFARNLEDIIHYVEKLNQLDVSKVKPTSHVLDVENVFRQDQPVPSLTNDEALSFAVDKHAGFFKVPKVIE